MTDHRLDAKPGHLSVTTYPATIWLSASFSRFWYDDAVREARGSDEHAVRREIVFSACFLESYIFEWARDLLQHCGLPMDRVNDYFPLEPRHEKWKRNLKEKWKYVPHELADCGLIPAKPDLTSSRLWSELCDLVDFRNGLIHARASRPSTEGLNEKARPVPAVEALRHKGPGWAIGVATELVKKLHLDIGTSHPEYIR